MRSTKTNPVPYSRVDNPKAIALIAIVLLGCVIASRAHSAGEEIATYTVQRGDTLSAIALDFYGNARAWRAIAEANATITNPDRLRVGQKLAIPARGDTTEPSQKTTVQIATSDAYPPFADRDLPKGGMTVHITKQALKRAGYSPKVVWLDSWTAVRERTAAVDHDLAIPYVRTPERSDFAFSEPLYPMYSQLFVRADSALPANWSRSDLKGKIACKPNGYYASDIQPYVDDGTVALGRADSPAGCLKKIADGTADFAPFNRFTGWQAIVESDSLTPDDFRHLRRPLGTAPLRAMVSKEHPQRGEMIRRFNEALHTMRESGELQSLQQKGRQAFAQAMPNVARWANTKGLKMASSGGSASESSTPSMSSEDSGASDTSESSQSNQGSQATETAQSSTSSDASQQQATSGPTCQGGDGPVLYTSNNYPPFADQGLPQQGMSTEVVRRAIKRAYDSEPEICFAESWPKAEQAAKNGQAVGTFPYVRTKARKDKGFAFSKSLHGMRVDIFVKQDHPLKQFSGPVDLDGMATCKPQGYYTKDLTQALQNDLISLQEPRPATGSACFESLAQDNVDFISMNPYVAALAVGSASGIQASDIRSAGQNLNVALHVMVRNNDQGQQFLNNLNSALETMWSDGSIQEIRERHLNQYEGPKL